MKSRWPRNRRNPGGDNAGVQELIIKAAIPDHTAPLARKARDYSQPDLRPYQAEVIARTYEAIDAGIRRPLLVAPTGAGKTVIAARWCRPLWPRANASCSWRTAAS